MLSGDLERSLGGVVLKSNNHLKVQLKNPELDLMVEIRENGKKN